MMDTSHILPELPYLISLTILSILLVLSTLIGVCRAKRLREILRQILLLLKDQPLPNHLYKAIYHQLHLPLQYREDQVINNHWQMIEMLESQDLSYIEWLRLKRLVERLSYVLPWAFQSIISKVKRWFQPNANKTLGCTY